MHHTSDSVFIKSDPLTTFVSLTAYCGPSEVRRCPQVLQAGLQKTYIINIQDIWLDNLGLNNKKWMTTSSAKGPARKKTILLWIVRQHASHQYS